MKTIDPRIIDIFRRVTKNPDISEKNARDPFMVLGWDSLKNVEILIEIQNVFCIEIEPEEMLRLRDMGDLQKLIRNKQKTNQPFP